MRHVKTYHITRNMSPWSGFTTTWEEEERGRHIIARVYPNGDFLPWQPLADYTVDGVPLLFRSDSLREVSVNSDYFRDMERIDATMLEKEENLTIGYYAKIPPSGPGFLVDFLIQSHIITTLRHVESNLTLVKCIENADFLEYHFSGEHVYYTRKAHREPIAFTVKIGNNGSMDVTGG